MDRNDVTALPNNSEALLGGGGARGGDGRGVRWPVLVKELKKLAAVAAPMVVVTVSQYLPEVVSLMMVGHISKLSLSSVSIATALCTVTGFSVLLGMAGALETLAGQAYGAEQYKKVGIYMYSATISLILVCFPISLLWCFIHKLLVLVGQDPLISAEAGRYAICLIPTLFAYAILQSLVRYFQSQSLILPMLISSVATLGLHTLLCWALVFKFGLGYIGVAFSNGLCCWLNVIFLGLYIKYSAMCEKTRTPFSRDAFIYIPEFFRLAVPSSLMVCLEWWSFELLVLLCGLFPNPQLETSTLSICLTITSLHYFIPYGFSAAASTRISNELGGGYSEEARVVAWAVSVLAIIEAVIVCSALFACRHILGYAYSNDEEVIRYITKMAPFICLSFALDCFQTTLSGVARGTGWQYIGAYINLGAFYLVGLPMAALFGFFLDWRAMGLWIGTEVGSVAQLTMLTILTSTTNWQKQAMKARERISEDFRQFPNVRLI